MILCVGDGGGGGGSLSMLGFFSDHQTKTSKKPSKVCTGSPGDRLFSGCAAITGGNAATPLGKAPGDPLGCVSVVPLMVLSRWFRRFSRLVFFELSGTTKSGQKGRKDAAA